MHSHRPPCYLLRTLWRPLLTMVITNLARNCRDDTSSPIIKVHVSFQLSVQKATQLSWIHSILKVARKYSLFLFHSCFIIFRSNDWLQDILGITLLCRSLKFLQHNLSGRYVFIFYRPKNQIPRQNFILRFLLRKYTEEVMLSLNDCHH